MSAQVPSLDISLYSLWCTFFPQFLQNRLEGNKCQLLPPEIGRVQLSNLLYDASGDSSYFFTFIVQVWLNSLNLWMTLIFFRASVTPVDAMIPLVHCTCISNMILSFYLFARLDSLHGRWRAVTHWHDFHFKSHSRHMVLTGLTDHTVWVAGSADLELDMS